ncbi:hypothetical protein PG995_015951 [Apiospora arundinis]
MWPEEKTEASLADLMEQAECYHIINKKHSKVREAGSLDGDMLLKYPMLYMGLYAESLILEDEDKMKEWLWKLLHNIRGVNQWAEAWSAAKSLEARRVQRQLANGAAYGPEPPDDEKCRNLVIMDWGAWATDHLLQRWGILRADKLRIRDDSRVQFWDLRQWDRMAQLASNPCPNPRDFAAPLAALGIGHRLRRDPYGLKNRDVRGNAGNDAWLKLAIFLSFFAMSGEEEAVFAVTGQPLSSSSSRSSPIVELERDARVLKANQRLDREVHPWAFEGEPSKPIPVVDRVEIKPETPKTLDSVSELESVWDATPSTPLSEPSCEGKKEGEDSAALASLNQGWQSRLTFDMAPLVPLRQ